MKQLNKRDAAASERSWNNSREVRGDPTGSCCKSLYLPTNDIRMWHAASTASAAVQLSHCTNRRARTYIWCMRLHLNIMLEKASSKMDHGGPNNCLTAYTMSACSSHLNRWLQTRSISTPQVLALVPNGYCSSSMYIGNVGIASSVFYIMGLQTMTDDVLLWQVGTPHWRLMNDVSS